VTEVLHIYVDADACPVKQEIYKVARRYGLEVTVVANSWMRIPQEDWVSLIVVEKGPDVADDWIVEHLSRNDVVITGDILLAARCIDEEAQVLGLKGRPFTTENVSNAVAMRNLMKDLREEGTMTRGPAPFEKKDRSRFLQGLDQMIQAIRRSSQV
jgi:uncharacterized protein YaiI (UPF0178 family)